MFVEDVYDLINISYTSHHLRSSFQYLVNSSKCLVPCLIRFCSRYKKLTMERSIKINAPLSLYTFIYYGINTKFLIVRGVFSSHSSLCICFLKDDRYLIFSGPWEGQVILDNWVDTLITPNILRKQSIIGHFGLIITKGFITSTSVFVIDSKQAPYVYIFRPYKHLSPLIFRSNDMLRIYFIQDRFPEMQMYLVKSNNELFSVCVNFLEESIKSFKNSISFKTLFQFHDTHFIDAHTILDVNQSKIKKQHIEFQFDIHQNDDNFQVEFDKLKHNDEILNLFIAY